MAKLNCWEYMSCGREPGGVNADELGICPASIYMPFHDIHGGIAAGRTCWAVAGTMCKGKVSGTFARKLRDCNDCRFYGHVKDEEGDRVLLTVDILSLVDKRVSERPSGMLVLPEDRTTEPD